MWDPNCFHLSNQFTSEVFVGVEGVWRENGCEIVIVNVYASCERGRRRSMWEELREIKRVSNIAHWCIVGVISIV